MIELLKKGQISLMVAMIGAVGVIIASAITTWATTSSRVSDTEKTVSVLEERENNHYAEVQKRLGSIEDKIDLILRK